MRLRHGGMGRVGGGGASETRGRVERGRGGGRVGQEGVGTDKPCLGKPTASRHSSKTGIRKCTAKNP